MTATTFPVQRNYFYDNIDWQASGSAPNDFFIKSSFARMAVQTTAQFDGTFSVSAVPTAASYSLDNCVSLRVDGAYHQVIPFDNRNSGVAQTINVRGLPAGAHLLELEEVTTGAVNITAVTLSNGAPLVATPPARRLIVLGDSLSCCVNAGVYQGGLQGRTLGWGMKLRHGSRFDGVALIGKSGEFAKTYFGDAPGIAALIARVGAAMDGTVENQFLYALGTNDYSGVWTAAAYQVGLSNGFDALHLAYPGLRMGLSTTWTESNEGPNGVGSTKADYDNATLAVAAARPGYCYGINATATVSLSQLSTWGGDGNVHYGNTGHQAVFDQLLPLI